MFTFKVVRKWKSLPENFVLDSASSGCTQVARLRLPWMYQPGHTVGSWNQATPVAKLEGFGEHWATLSYQCRRSQQVELEQWMSGPLGTTWRNSSLCPVTMTAHQDATGPWRLATLALKQNVCWAFCILQFLASVFWKRLAVALITCPSL